MSYIARAMNSVSLLVVFQSVLFVLDESLFCCMRSGSALWQPCCPEQGGDSQVLLASFHLLFDVLSFSTLFSDLWMTLLSIQTLSDQSRSRVRLWCPMITRQSMVQFATKGKEECFGVPLSFKVCVLSIASQCPHASI